ncbi:cholesterol oxidase-like [Oculina patagonica]
MGCVSSTRQRAQAQEKPLFPRLSLPHTSIKSHYDVVVVGSGYGASIAASRCARAGKSVCVLERGKEWWPGDFPETFSDSSKHMQITFGGKEKKLGKPTDLYEFFVTDDLTVVQGCGLGGGSLINANVGLDVEPEVYQDPVWPKELREDLDQLTKVDRQHFVDMIKPSLYPDSYPPLHKLERMKEGLSEFDIEDLDKLYYKTPLYVTFQDTPSNHVGIPQPKCTGCGNCLGGCNVGAKNTLNMNYLPDAKAHGAEMFTEVEVTAVMKSDNSTDWFVKYKRLVPGSVDLEEYTVRANYVILGAGALGSTKILLRSKERGLRVSDGIGKRFSTNGDAVGFSYNGDKIANSVGVETKDISSAQPPGPTVTSIIDFRKVNGGNFEDNFIVEDGTPPSILAVPFTVGLSFGAKVSGIDKYPPNELLEKTFQEIQGKGIDNTLTLLAMGHDSSSGVISFENKIDDIDITWDRVGYERNFENINQALEKLTRGLGGTYVKNPMWSQTLGRSVITVHPLGGCPMGESGRTAVVNHAGQVFDGDTNKLLDGLYVVDGSIIPRSVGVNPSLAIGCLAERCMRLLAEREGWSIDYDTFISLGRETFANHYVKISSF